MSEDGRQRVTMKMVAARAGVSVSTVSLALRDHPAISLATRERVARVARDLGFTQNPVVAQLMSELRNSRVRGFRRTIGLLNADPRETALADHVSLPALVTGAGERAAAHGHRCEEFWLCDPRLGPRSLERALRAKGIRGVLILGMRDRHELLERFTAVWQSRACVVVGVRPRSLPLSYCQTDLYLLVRDAVDELLRIGYRRPALVLDRVHAEVSDGRLGAGMWAAQQGLSEDDRVPGFCFDAADAGEAQRFLEWYEPHRPDVILTHNRVTVNGWLNASGYEIPRDVGVVVLDRNRDAPGWACMDQRGQDVGAAAVDLLVGLLDRNEVGVPLIQRSIVTTAAWTAGASIVARDREPSTNAR